MTLTAAHLKRIKSALAHGVVALLFGLATGQVMAADVDISDKPLDTLEGVPANIILTMDDSGSMAWGYLPDSHTNTGDDRWASHVYNRLYYNPNITYSPGVDKNGASLGNASFTAAWHNAYNKGTGTVDLSSSFQPRYYDYRPTQTWTSLVGSAEAAYYYVFDTSKTAADATTCDIATAAHVNDADNCYTKVVVSSTSGVNRYDPDFTACSPRDQSNTDCYTNDERQNFANWYSYYSIRHLLAKTATSRAFSGLSTSVRISWQELNNLTTIGNTLPFGGSHRDNFFTWLYGAPTDGSTPLTNALKRAGDKYMNDSVYRKDPADNTSDMYSCRQNFHFAFTDGYWNSNSVDLSPDNYDNQASKALPTSGSSPYGDINYNSNSTLTADEALPIYRDGNDNFLGDIAFYYWSNDLNTNLDDEVPTFITDISTDMDGDGDVDNYDIFWNPANDPADWQHMVNFMVGLGIDGILPNTTSTYQDLLTGAATWPTSDPNADDQHHVDDLWHAAVNSRGRYFSARNPAQLLAGFKGVLDAIDDRVGSSSAVATTSSQYQAGTNLFQAIYDPSTWAGDLVAKDVVSLNIQWSAANILAQQIDGTINSPRKIITFDPGNNGGGIPFQWDDLTATQKSALQDGGSVTMGQNRLAYLRGDASNELKNGGSFRNRASSLGDLVHSDPFFLPPPGAPLFFWPDSLESVAYSTFVAGRTGRQDMVLFGGNDGMLHIVNASTGREILAYVPNLVFDNLSNLTDPGYNHQFFVDAPIQVSDVFYGGDWQTVAVGGLGKGGKGIYALDVTNPANFLESNAASLALWEFTDVDLGYTYTKPQIFKMNNGKWVVAIGNGYNSGRDTDNDGDIDRGFATLYLLDIEDGSLIKKIETPWGVDQDPTGQRRSNRLTDVVALDQNQDFQVDFLYAGDLFGNLWKFDVSDAQPNKWTIVKSGSTPTPLFQARDDNNNAQPITVAPAIQFHDIKNGYMLYVGTGKYVEASDPADASIQTVYGVWDREESSNITTIDRPSLLEQKIEGAERDQFLLTNARVTTANKMTWYDGNGLPNNGGKNKSYLGWYMDLGDIDNNGDPIALGERVLDDLFVSGDRLEFITLVPSTNPCVGGGESWIFAVNAFTGSRFTDNTPWDYNLDGRYDTDDKVNWGGGGAQVWGSGINLKTPQRFRRTKLLEPGSDCQEVNLLNNSDGSITTVSGSCKGFNYGRRSWRQLQIQ